VKAATYIHLMRFSSTGEVLWSHPYPSSGNTQGSDIVRLPDGGYAIVGSSNNNTEFYLLLLDSKFDVRQEYRWGTPERLNRLTVATLAANGDLLLGGVTNDDGLANKNYFARVKLPNAVVSQKSYAEELRVFPNPTAGRIEVSFKNPSHPRTLELIDVKGRVLRVLHIDAYVSSSDAVSVDTSDLPSGLYLLRLMGDGLVAIAPLVKF
jgi:hypothetical protein